jgi:hypothetical protein
MKKVIINFHSIVLFCEVELNQKNNIDNGFNVISISLENSEENIKDIIDEKINQLIYENLKINQ